MLEMLRAHGLDAGPTQRPLLAGALAGVLADVPALAVFAGLGTLQRIAEAIAGSTLVVGLLHAVAMAAGGMGYGLLFRRAANDAAGAWLFGMSYGFLLWMVAAVPLLQWLPSEPVLRGLPAAGLYLGQVAWGLAVGLAFRPVHRPFMSGVDGRLPAWLDKAGSR